LALFKLKLAAATGTLALIASSAIAAPITLESDFVRVSITDKGVFNSLRYDSAGTGTFAANKDYVSPGTPFEGFGVKVGTGAVQANSNSGGTAIAGSLAAASGSFNYGALWTGGNTQYSLSHLFYFNDGDERVNIRTTLTALSDLGNVRFSRAVDPDPDNYSGGSASTNNQRGIVAQGIPVEDFVGSLGSISGLPLGLFYSGLIVHNTGIVDNCCSTIDPDVYLSGGDQGNSSSGDDGIGLAFNLGNLSRGQALTWDYAYVMGGSLDSIDIPGGGTVPEPTSLVLLGLSLGTLGLMRRRRKSA